MGDDDITVKARKVLDDLWKNSDLRGRCWGVKTKRPDNPYAGTNITMGYGQEIVSVCEIDGKLVVHEFARASGTELGKRVWELLKENHLV